MLAGDDDDDDFQEQPAYTTVSGTQTRLPSSVGTLALRPRKRLKLPKSIAGDNGGFDGAEVGDGNLHCRPESFLGFEAGKVGDAHIRVLSPPIGFDSPEDSAVGASSSRICLGGDGQKDDGKEESCDLWASTGFKSNSSTCTMKLKNPCSMSIESRLLRSSAEKAKEKRPVEEDDCVDFEPGTQLRELMNLCCEMNEDGQPSEGYALEWENDSIECPLCGIDISSLSEDLRHAHTNGCIEEKEEEPIGALNRILEATSASSELNPPRLAHANGCLEGSVNFETRSADSKLLKSSVESGSMIDSRCAEVNAHRSLLHVLCPLCGVDISEFSEELRHVHTNNCLDDGLKEVRTPDVATKLISPGQVVDANPVLEWLKSLDLSKYEDAFAREEIDWETLRLLTEEDLIRIGITALGPRKKIVHALHELKKSSHCANIDESSPSVFENKQVSLPGNKLITEYFKDSDVSKNKNPRIREASTSVRNSRKVTGTKKAVGSRKSKGKERDVPPWCCISGTPFRVDAFRYLRGDCSHWFLTHFHVDHYQGLTKNFCHGKIYCSNVTAQLLHTRIGVARDKLHILTLNERINIAGVDVICFDANHCPGSIIIIFEPPNGKAVLHTGDFRFCEGMASNSTLQTCRIHTLILDTTYCDPKYDFPKQEAVIQFVIEAIQAEAFNPQTLFLIGSYTVGKERLFLEIARFLRKKVYVGASKLLTLKCMGLPEDDMQWLTANEAESHIHVVPMWSIASFKRMKHVVKQYSSRFNLIVAFSPTGWTAGKGKKKGPGRRSQQGTIIRYDVPYSEHSSFQELREFVQFISPEKIIPSVNNDDPESADTMLALLTS